jgi:hypothetical protein
VSKSAEKAPVDDVLKRMNELKHIIKEKDDQISEQEQQIANLNARHKLALENYHTLQVGCSL